MNDKLYYTITEVADMLGVNASLLRFWESEFDSLRPAKNKRGVRRYTADDIELLRRIHYLTRDCGYTLEGAREQLRTKPVDDPSQQLADTLRTLRTFLTDLKSQL